MAVRVSRNSDLPFPRGTTPGDSLTSVSSWEGQEFVVQDATYSTGEFITLRCVRNVATITLAPKRLVSFKLTAGTTAAETQVDGYAGDGGDAERGYPVDDQYTANIPINDLFYIVVKGLCKCSTGLAAGARTSIAAGDNLVAQTAAASTSTTAGRVGGADFTGATSPLGTAVLNIVGRAVSASTTNQTGSDILVSVGKW